VCGPSGSGATTTLYAALATVAAPDRVVTTVERPVERLLDGVDQIEVDPTTGTSFASVLRELRFTDPDAVLVGEIADRETAELTLQAAFEGRVVLAALQAPTAAASLAQLADLGVDPSVLGSSLGCVVAQRLVRTICPDCRETYYASEDELASLGQPTDGSPRLLARGKGCDSCQGSGFGGRTGLFEVLELTDDVRRLVAERASAKKLQRAAVAAGMRTLRDEGVRLCLDGVTTASEVTRVLRADA
jgi:type II secretory ATPase GspE/PulE/Tfp pilus assembly ATPase PilB-like protein